MNGNSTVGAGLEEVADGFLEQNNELRTKRSQENEIKF